MGNHRYLFKYIWTDLQKKMVFLGGPRQCGKTTLAKSILEQEKCQNCYFNWDDEDDKKKILNKNWNPTAPIVAIDEFHKFPRWKNWIKGVFDKRNKNQNFLLTGSARMDIYQRGGDSLLGRYHYWRLHPYTLDELPDGINPETAFERLMKVGGFPEPFLEGDEVFAKRWNRDRLNLVLKQDARDLEKIASVENLSLLLTLLRRRVGNEIILSHLAQDLHVSPNTITHWLQILEKLYLVFRVKPFTKKIARAIQKPPKIYFYNNADVDIAADGSVGFRFENLVATHLLKRIHFLEDSQGDEYELSYIRDKDKREVDFVIVKNGKIEEILEVKYAETNLSNGLLYYRDKLKIAHATQIVATLSKPYHDNGVYVTNPIDYFTKQSLY